MLYTLRFFFSSKCSLFRNANLFGSCIVHILYTECAKIKKKNNNSGAKRLINRYIEMHGQQNIKIHTMSITLKVSTPLGQWRIVMLGSALAEG